MYVDVGYERDSEIIEHMRKVRKGRQAPRSNNRNNKDLLGSCEAINLAF